MIQYQFMWNTNDALRSGPIGIVKPSSFLFIAIFIPLSLSYFSKHFINNLYKIDMPWYNKKMEKPAFL